MNELDAIQKKYCSQALLAAIFIALVCVVAGAKPIGKGLVLGAMFSIINFVLIAHSLPLQINKGRNKTFFYCLGGIGLRYVLLAIPLIVAMKSDGLDFFSAAAGLFMVQAVIMAHHVKSLIAPGKS